MRYFSGFSLTNERHVFDAWLNKSDFTVAGFSYGAIKAFEHALNSNERIDTLQLFSPAFYHGTTAGFKRLQLRGFKRDAAAYLTQFLERCFSPYPSQRIETTKEDPDDLEKLLYFEWSDAGLRTLAQRGTRIEVYLGEKDAVIDADAARRFFNAFAVTYYFKNANHFLQGAVQ